MVRISETGRARRSDVDARRTYVMSVLLSEFTPEERNDLADLLSRYVTALDQTVSRLT
jgi:hypothetical protein